MRNFISIIILSLMFSFMFACTGMSPEQEAIMKELKLEITQTNKAVAEALAIPSDLLLKLNEKEITADEFRVAMGDAKKAITDAQNNFHEATQKYTEAKEAGITNSQIGISLIGGTFGRSILHALAGYLSGMGGIPGMLGGIAAASLGGSKSKNIEVVPDKDS